MDTMSPGQDVVWGTVLSELFRPAVYAWCAQYALMVKGHTIWGVLVLSSTLQNIIVRVSGTERLSVVLELQGCFPVADVGYAAGHEAWLL